ncbi:MAG: class I SAM-dependent methyltransferase [Chloroflexi bacterium]|nr:class I SAM-dependent methyltransferase [Chloroflexota bacterium]
MSDTVKWNAIGNLPEIYEHIFVPAVMNVWAHKVVNQLSPRQGHRILDMACGTGAVTIEFAHRLGKESRIVGYDISPEMLEVARRKWSFTGIDWQLGDVSQLPFQDGSFDIVTCHFALMFFPDRVGALKEMYRVLAPGGQLLALVWGAIERNPGFHAVAEGFGHHFSADAREGIRGSFVLGDREKVRALAAAAGFTDAHVYELNAQAYFPSVESLVHGYGALLQAAIDWATYTRLMDSVTADLRSYVTSGVLIHPIEAIAMSVTKHVVDMNV